MNVKRKNVGMGGVGMVRLGMGGVGMGLVKWAPNNRRKTAEKLENSFESGSPKPWKVLEIHGNSKESFSAKDCYVHNQISTWWSQGLFNAICARAGGRLRCSRGNCSCTYASQVQKKVPPRRRDF